MILVDSYIYITGDSKIWKTDEQLNVLVTHANSTALYRGLCYESVKRMIYVALYNFEVIDVFNMDLSINKSISSTPYRPWSINEHNNELYVGTTNGTVLVIVDYQIIKKFNGCNGQNSWLYSMMFDIFNNMATLCSNKQLSLYETTGTYLNQSIYTIDVPFYFMFDSKSRLIVVTNTLISLYN
jgi:hypothetical protein